MANKKNAGRKSVYEIRVKPKFDDIVKWLKDGASEKMVAKKLGITQKTLIQYKKKYPEFKELLDNIDYSELVQELRSALLKKALGFQYEEKKTYIKHNTQTDSDYQYTEIITRTALPDVAAINLALKNYDRDNWSNDWHAEEFKRQELKIRELMVQMKKDENW